MTISITLPDLEFAPSANGDGERLFKIDLAMWLYMKGYFTKGQVKNLTGLTQMEFQHELAERGGFINYTPDDLLDDVKNLKELGLLK